MGTVSTVPVVKDALVTTLDARVGLDGVQVAREWPGDAIKAEAIWLGKVDGTHQIATMRAGRKDRAEEYRLEVIVSVVKNGVEAAEERAFVLLGEIESALADDPRIGLTSINWATVADFESVTTRGQSGAVAEIRVFVEVNARLT